MPKKFHLLVHSLLLVTSPSLLIYPESKAHAQQIFPHQVVAGCADVTYDDILHFLQNIEQESDDLPTEKSQSIMNFVCLLAQQGLIDRNLAARAELEKDIAALFQSAEDSYGYDYCFYADNSFDEYSIIPALMTGQEELLLCKHRRKKKPKETGTTKSTRHGHGIFSKIKDFVVKHKKAILIGAAIAVAAAAAVFAIVTISSSAAAAAAGAVAAAAAAPPQSSGERSPQTNSPKHQEDSLKSIIDGQVAGFKESIVENQFFQSISDESLSLEESGRALGSLFAHDSYKDLQYQIFNHPRLSQEIRDLHAQYARKEGGGGHAEIDQKFATEYSYLYADSNQDANFNTLSHQVLGEKALSLGYYNEAVQNLGMAIRANPTSPIPYLERGIAHFGLGQYDRSLEDYHSFTAQVQPQKSHSLSVTEFSVGFAKGLPKGIYESGEGLILFMADFVTHPIQTSKQIVDSVNTLVDLARQDEWGVVAQSLSPEVHQLVTQWDTLPSDKKGELAGYALGKHGADILAPGALAKIASKSAKSAQELIAVCKNLELAQETLILETAAGMGNSAKIAEVIEAGQYTARVADELGFTAQEVGQLRQSGQLETVVNNTFEHLSLSMQESVALHKKAGETLKPYVKKPMPEARVRELIHETGIPTFPRPHGIPEDYIITISANGAGMEYIHPTNRHIRIRVMPGKAHSPNPCQQRPYVIQKTDRGVLDKTGKLVAADAPEAHIPIEEFIYRDYVNGH